MYCTVMLFDVSKIWEEMASLEEQRHIGSWILPIWVLHCPFIPWLPAFLCLFIYSDIKQRVQKALGLLCSMFKVISLFMAYEYWAKTWLETNLFVFGTEVQVLIGTVCFRCHHKCVPFNVTWIHAVTAK